MVNNDGAVLFSSEGSILAYRVFFYRVDAAATQDQVGTPSVVGGARRQAYEDIRLSLGQDIQACLFRSQDGQVLCHGA